MIRWPRLSLALLAGTLLTASAALALENTTAPATGPARPSSPAPAFAALAYYDQNCARCHGPDGSFYGTTLGNDLTDDGLIKEIRDMAKGPAGAPLHEPEVAVETAYHRALILHTPFLSVTDMATTHWSGEASPGATVTLTVGTTQITAVLTDWTWTAALPPNTDPRQVTIAATLDGKSVTLHPAEATFSSITPLPPVKDRK